MLQLNNLEVRRELEAKELNDLAGGYFYGTVFNFWRRRRFAVTDRGTFRITSPGTFNITTPDI